MNYGELEKFVVACCFHDTVFLERVFDDHITTEAYRALIEKCREITYQNNRSEINRTELMARTKLGPNTVYSTWDIDSIYETIEFDIANKKKDSVKDKFIESLALLMERWRINEIRMVLADADRNIEEGDVNKGIAKLKSLRMNLAKQVDTTEDVILSSLHQSNGIASGIRCIDEKVGGWYKGNIMTVYGDSGMLKTQVTMWLALKALEKNPNATCLFFEKEMHKKDLGRRLAAFYAGVEGDLIFKYNRDKNTTKLKEIEERVKKALYENKDILDRFHVIGESDFDSAYDMMEFVDAKRPDIVVLDFVMMLGDGYKQRRMGKTDKDGYWIWLKEQLDIINHFTKDNEVFTILVNQINLKALQNRVLKIPLIEDMEYGSKLKQYSSYIYAVFYPSNYMGKRHDVSKKLFYMINQKNRHGIRGLDIMLQAYPNINAFEEPDDITAQTMETWINEYKTSR